MLKWGRQPSLFKKKTNSWLADRSDRCDCNSVACAVFVGEQIRNKNSWILKEHFAHVKHPHVRKLYKFHVSVKP